MDPLAVFAYRAEQALPLIGMEWNGTLNLTTPLPAQLGRCYLGCLSLLRCLCVTLLFVIVFVNNITGKWLQLTL